MSRWQGNDLVLVRDAWGEYTVYHNCPEHQYKGWLGPVLDDYQCTECEKKFPKAFIDAALMLNCIPMW